MTYWRNALATGSCARTRISGKRVRWSLLLLLLQIMRQVALTHADDLDLSDMQVLDLRTAVGIALADNPSIGAARARVDQAKGRLGQATSRRWPSLRGSASLTRRDTADGLVVPSSAFPDPADIFSAELQAQWVLFDGFSHRHAILAARFARDGSSEALEDSRRQLVTTVARAFYIAQLARENISIAEADEAFNHRQLDEAEARHRAGVGSLSDSLNFEVRANAAKSSLIRARRSYEIAMTTLASLLAIPGAIFPEPLTLSALAPESSEEMLSPQVSALLTSALLYRPDANASARNADRAEAQVHVDEAENWPSVALQGSVNGERVDDPGFDSDDLGTRVGATVTYTFSDGGARKARIRESKATSVEAQKNHESLALNIAAEVRESVAEVRRAQEQLVLQRENAKLVARNRDLVEKEYNAGQGSLVHVNEAQRDLVNARAQLALALVSLRTAHVSLQSTTGEILSRFPQEETP